MICCGGVAFVEGDAGYGMLATTPDSTRPRELFCVKATHCRPRVNTGAPTPAQAFSDAQVGLKRKLTQPVELRQIPASTTRRMTAAALAEGHCHDRDRLDVLDHSCVNGSRPRSRFQPEPAAMIAQLRGGGRPERCERPRVVVEDPETPKLVVLHDPMLGNPDFVATRSACT